MALAERLLHVSVAVYKYSCTRLIDRQVQRQDDKVRGENLENLVV